MILPKRCSIFLAKIPPALPELRWWWTAVTSPPRNGNTPAKPGLWSHYETSRTQLEPNPSSKECQVDSRVRRLRVPPVAARQGPGPYRRPGFQSCGHRVVREKVAYLAFKSSDRAVEIGPAIKP